MVVSHDIRGDLLEIVDKSSLYSRKEKRMGIGWEILVQTLLLDVAISKNRDLNP